MEITKTKSVSNTALLFVLVAPFTVIFYASYVFNPANRGNILLYFLLLFADSTAIIIVGSLWITIILDLLGREYHRRKILYNLKWLETHKLTVDVLVPTANEPFDIVSETIKKVVAMDYPHKTFVLDDGNSNKIKELCKKFKIIYLNRKNRHMAKAGNLNYGLMSSKAEFFAVFDADHMPKAEFLNELLPFFENPKVALVQTPQHYINTANFIASGTAQAQELFYKYVQPAKNSYNASFCVGTNMIYRRSAIDEIGGIAMLDHSEDIWTTIQLHEKKYDSVFYNKILAEGRAPETISSFFRQQNRWAMGGFSLFFTHNPLAIKNLSLDQKFQYFFSNIHYFSGFAILIYLVLPIIFLLTGQSPIDVKYNGIWLVHYIPYFISVYFLPVFLLGNMKISTLSVSLASFYPYLKAFFSTVLKNSYIWIATESDSVKTSFLMMDIWPHLFLIILSLLSILVGWYNVVDFPITIVTTIWTLVNSSMLIMFIRNKKI